jgi:hypothetical protein
MTSAIATTCSQRARKSRQDQRNQSAKELRLPEEALDIGLATFRRAVPDHAATTQFNYTVGRARDFAVMGDNQGHVIGLCLLLEEPEDANAGMEVQLAGRFIGQ